MRFGRKIFSAHRGNPIDKIIAPPWLPVRTIPDIRLGTLVSRVTIKIMAIGQQFAAQFTVPDNAGQLMFEVKRGKPLHLGQCKAQVGGKLYRTVCNAPSQPEINLKST